MADSFKLIALVVRHNIEAENVYDTDKTGFTIDHAQSRVIGIIRHPRDDNGGIFPADLPELNLRGGQKFQDGSRQFATAVCCICADGAFFWVRQSFSKPKIFRAAGLAKCLACQRISYLVYQPIDGPITQKLWPG